MEESQEISLEPVINTKQGEEKKPYQEQKEQWGKKKFDTLIVFGQGPVKAVVFREELTSEQQKQWDDFIKDPLHQKEPDFRVVQHEANKADNTVIDEWQKMGRMALNRWGRQNALAAGLALYLGITDKLILTGGKTGGEDKPSEAQLMKDIIVRRFGKMYEKQYKKSIEEALIIEDSSTKTPENVLMAINKDPSLLESKNNGFIGAHFHLMRSEIIARDFSLPLAERGAISAQDLLKEMAGIRNKKTYEEMLNYMTDHLNNPDYRDRVTAELRYTLSLTNERYLRNWIGFLADDEQLVATQNVLGALAKDSKWAVAAKEAFQMVGLDFDSFRGVDLKDLETTKPEEFRKLKEGLRTLKAKRIMAPDLKEI